jgi:hypothetical protein
MNTDIFVTWYDDYYDPHDSKVYCVDLDRDRFLVIDENSNFHWVFIRDCKLLRQEDVSGLEQSEILHALWSRDITDS